MADPIPHLLHIEVKGQQVRTAGACRGDDTIYVPLHVAETITKLSIRKMELISICKRVSGNVTR